MATRHAIERHDVLARPPVSRALAWPAAASLVVSLAVWVGFGRWRSAWESFQISLVYSVAISMAGGWVVTPLLRRMGVGRLPIGVWLTLVFAGAAAAGCLAAGALSLMLGLAPPGAFWETYFRFTRITSVLAIAAGFVAFFYDRLGAELRQTRIALREKELQEERARKQALEARLSSLESRVHPHFLFNTLNSLSALISVDPVRAERLVGRLAALLRSSLSLADRRAVPLDREMSLVRDYLDIEQERLGDRLRYTIDIPPDAARCQVPPFSVQSLVENAVKHAIASREQGGRVAVRAHRDGSRLRVEVRDSGPGFDLSRAPGGHGIDNLVARLETLCGPDAGLEVARRDDGSVVVIHLPATEAASAAEAAR
jgi:signal transduction histidine kinase